MRMVANWRTANLPWIEKEVSAAIANWSRRRKARGKDAAGAITPPVHDATPGQNKVWSYVLKECDEFECFTFALSPLMWSHVECALRLWKYPVLLNWKIAKATRKLLSIIQDRRKNGLPEQRRRDDVPHFMGEFYEERQGAR